MHRPVGSLAQTAIVLLVMAWPTCQLAAQYGEAEAPPANLAPGFDSIDSEQCREWLNILASPAFEGRGTGQEGHVKAAHWVAGKCAEFGLKPMGDGGTYFQMLPMTRLLVDESQSKLTGPEGLSLGFAGAIGLDRFVNQPEFSGKLVFLRMNGNVSNLDAELNLRDKIVILVADEKARSGPSATAVARKRPIAVLRVTDGTPTSTSQLQRPSSRSQSSSVSGTISQVAAQQLLQAAQGADDWLTACEENQSVVHPTELDVKIELRVREEPTAVPNVLAWQQGADSDVEDEYLVLGAHLDHLGIRGDAVYPGADDNGSGSTAVLNIAKAVSLNPVKPKRSILFMWFAAEELGLVGSAHYVANPVLPLDKMICMLNVDMVGRNEEKGSEPARDNERSLHLVGSKKGDTALHELILQANQCVNFEFEYDEEGVFGRSDQINFFKKGTSIAFLFGGFHPDYHRTTDELSKINFHKIASAARLYYLTVHLAAEHGPFPVPKSEEPAAESPPAVKAAEAPADANKLNPI